MDAGQLPAASFARKRSCISLPSPSLPLVQAHLEVDALKKALRGSPFSSSICQLVSTHPQHEHYTHNLQR